MVKPTGGPPFMKRTLRYTPVCTTPFTDLRLLARFDARVSAALEMPRASVGPAFAPVTRATTTADPSASFVHASAATKPGASEAVSLHPFQSSALVFASTTPTTSAHSASVSTPASSAMTVCASDSSVTAKNPESCPSSASRANSTASAKSVCASKTSAGAANCADEPSSLCSTTYGYGVPAMSTSSSTELKNSPDVHCVCARNTSTTCVMASRGPSKYGESCGVFAMT
mmetsp:Transcript_7360/g.16683  ORF Transcript_7360/g.16683 Transcript_7360/m.16683 type:complete len:229 (-) Transcript_7360:184-870(-)